MWEVEAANAGCKGQRETVKQEGKRDDTFANKERGKVREEGREEKRRKQGETS